MATPAHVYGLSPEDSAIVLDFLRRWEDAVRRLVDKWELPPDILEPAPVLEGHTRVTDEVFEGPKPHPKYLLAGLWDDLRWKSVLYHMYPGGEYRAVLHWEGLQGHPDYLPGPPHDNMVIEVKTVGPDRWGQIRRSGVLPHHKAQVLAYMRMAGRPLGLVVYERRDTLDVWVCVVREETDGV